MGRNIKVCSQREGGGIPTLPFTSCVPLGKLFTFLTLIVFLRPIAYTEQSGCEEQVQ